MKKLSSDIRSLEPSALLMVNIIRRTSNGRTGIR